MIFLILILCGILAGILAGLYGLGGGILFTPILFFLFTNLEIADPVSWTIGTSLFCTFTASFSSSVQQRKNRNFFWREGIAIGLFGAMGVYGGKLIVMSSYYTEVLFVSFFSFLLMVVAYMFFNKSRVDDQEIAINTGELNLFKSGSAGGLGGMVAALAGVGGGIVLVPMMNLGFKLSVAKAVSISSLAIVIISLSGWLQFAIFSSNPTGLTNFTLGFVDFGTGFPLIIGAFIGGFLGVKIGHEISRALIQKSFAFLIIVVAALMIWNLF